MKVAVLSSHTTSLFWFRMDMMSAFAKQGHDVVALGPEPESRWVNVFKENGIRYRQFFVERNGTNPFDDIRTYRELKKLLREEKPNKVFTYQVKTVVYGSLASRIEGVSEIYPLIAGLGSIMRGEGLKNKVFKTLLKVEYWIACTLSKKVFFQNTDDRDEFVARRLVRAHKTVIINGSGVNLDKFAPEPIPEKPAFLFIGRLIKDKGVREYLGACEQIKKEYPEVRCLLVGPYDSNPTAITANDLGPYLESGIVEYFGEQDDVRPFLKACSTFVLPSYHEGTPKTILEAMATGRSIITTDAPGCRETVVEGYNGFLVKAKSVEALVEKMRILIEDPIRNKLMAERSLTFAREKYDVKLVNELIVKTMGLSQEEGMK